MSRTTDAFLVGRRGFLTGAGAALMLSGGAVAQGRAGPTALNVWLRIDADSTVTVLMSQSWSGQGISTTLPLALADELGAEWPHVRTEWSPYDPAYRHPQYGWMVTSNAE